jgi:predicted transposase/invertase (TIGR01784 family)
MLAENLENWAKREREEGERIGMQKGRLEAAQETARNLLKLGVLSDGQIAQATGLTLAQVEALRSAAPH